MSTECSIGIILFAIIVGSLIGLFVLMNSATECYDGSVVAFPFNARDIENTQVNATEEGYPITCDGKIHYDAECSFMFYGVCQMRKAGLK